MDKRRLQVGPYCCFIMLPVIFIIKEDKIDSIITVIEILRKESIYWSQDQCNFQLLPAGDFGKKCINIKLALIKLESKFFKFFPKRKWIFGLTVWWLLGSSFNNSIKIFAKLLVGVSIADNIGQKRGETPSAILFRIIERLYS